MRPPVTALALIACVLTQGCSAIGKLHTQFGVMVGNNYGGEGERGVSNTVGVAELGYVTGESETETPPWGFGGTSYLSISDPMRPGIKAIVRRRLNATTDLDFSAGPMITYDSSGLFNGFVGGVALNVSFLTLRSEFMTWPYKAWNDHDSGDGGYLITPVYHPGGHEQMWYNGVSFNGTASWVAFAVGVGAMIVLGASGAFD